MNNTFDADEFYQQINKNFARGAKIILVLGILGIFFFGIGLIGIFAGTDRFNSDVTAALVLCLLFFTGSVWAVVYSRRMANPERNPVMRDIRTGGDHIVWCYNSNTTVNGVKSYAVAFMTRNGVKQTIPARNVDTQEDILYGISQLYPNAVIGYSPELARQMKQQYCK